MKGMVHMNNFKRHRRLRSTEAMRSLIRENHLRVDDLIYPLFVIEVADIRKEVPSMPGVFQVSLDRLSDEIKEIYELGIKGVLSFGVLTPKEDQGTEAFIIEAFVEDGIVQLATKQIKKEYPNLLVIADTCLCEYTSHGHCGVIDNHEIANDESLKLLAKTAVSQAKAGADIIAPSNMMDGFVTV